MDHAVASNLRAVELEHGSTDVQAVLESAYEQVIGALGRLVSSPKSSLL